MRGAPRGDLVSGKDGHIRHQGGMDKVAEIDDADDDIFIARVDKDVHVIHVVVDHLLPQMAVLRLNSSVDRTDQSRYSARLRKVAELVQQPDRSTHVAQIPDQRPQGRGMCEGAKRET
jgi:hypothetical protein